MASESHPIRITVVDDYDVVLVGVANMFNQYKDRISIVELIATETVTELVDIALYDSFAQPEADHSEILTLVNNPLARKVVVYTWNFSDALVSAALDKGASGYLSKRLTARELVDALEAIHNGEVIVSPVPPKNRLSTGLDWPGRTEGLSEREGEILALITQGKSNAEIADLVSLSPNSIKTYIRSAYRKIEVTNRVEAVLWGVDHGFKPDHHRLATWEPTPEPSEPET